MLTADPNPGSTELASPLAEPAFQRMVGRAALGPALVLGVALGILLTLTLFLINSASWVDHTNQVIGQAYLTEKLAVDMETALESFQLTGEPRLLEPRKAALVQIDPAFDRLLAMVADNPAQVAAASRQQAIFAKLRSDEEERLRAGDQARGGARNAEAKALFDTFREGTASFIGEEGRLRDERTARLTLVRNAVLAVLTLSALAGLPLLWRTLRRTLAAVSGAYHGALALTAAQRDELQTTLRSIGDAVLATDATGNIAFLNPVAEALTGWSDAEARGRSLLEVMPIFNEQTGAPAVNPVERVLRERRVVGLANHTVLRPRSGGEIAIEDSAAPILGSAGEVRGVILVFHDVREKHARERELREAEWMARTALEVGGAGAWVLDLERGIVVGDAQMAQLFGVPQERCRAGESVETFFAAVHEEDRARVREGVTAALETGEFCVLDYRVHGANGIERWVDGRGRVERDAAGKPVRMPGFCIEITERKKTEMALIAARESAEALARVAAEGAERFRLLAETVSLQVWTATPDGLLNWANHYVAGYFGTDDVERDVLGSAWAQLVHAEDLPRIGRLWAKSIASGERYEAEFRLRRGDGEYRWFLVRAEAMRDAGGTVVKWFGTNTEIEALKAAQTTAEAASRAKDNFLAALSHELRTPLTPVLMTASALREDLRLPPEVREQLSMMERNIALEARLIDDLLDVTRITQGKLPLRPQLCDAHSLISLAVEIVRDDAQARGIAINRSYDAELSGLVADPARFQQVMWNLLRNSVKFTPAGGSISIHTSNHTDAGGAARLQIAVSDSGRGIEAAALERIFQPFEQAGVAGDHRFGGLGLGLAIARAIVDLHGGTIRAESGGEEQGATFIVELPDATMAPHGVAEADRGAPPAAIDAVPAEKAKPLRLLLVEDHPATLDVLTRLLTRAGHSVVATSTVAAALAAADASTFNAVVSDLGLPDGTGTELMVQLRARHGLRGIALSGYGMEQDMERTREAGFIAHLVKPVDFNQLRRTLELLG